MRGHVARMGTMRNCTFW